MNVSCITSTLDLCSSNSKELQGHFHEDSRRVHTYRGRDRPACVGHPVLGPSIPGRVRVGDGRTFDTPEGTDGPDRSSSVPFPTWTGTSRPRVPSTRCASLDVGPKECIESSEPHTETSWSRGPRVNGRQI